jgi:hypothetical protein
VLDEALLSEMDRMRRFGPLICSFVYGFPKNERSDIDQGEAEALKKLAAYLLSLSPQAVIEAKRAGELIEVDCDAEDQVTDPGRRARHGPGVVQGGRDGSGHVARVRPAVPAAG